MEPTLFQSFFLIFTGAAIVASLALYTRQPLLVAYILLGMLLGPFGFAFITNVEVISEISRVGIIFLLFLLGLDMQPKALFAVLKQATHIGLISSAIFAGAGYAVGWLFGFSHLENLIIGMAMMFSSTIIGIKLLPTTVLHHKHTGDLMVGLLLLQDFLAIICLMVLLSGDLGRVDLPTLGKTFAALPLVALAAWAFVKWILLRLIQTFDRFHEYIFLVAIGWCMGLAELCEYLGLSAEIGAFIAGITLATSPISQYIAISLKPLRDFFLIIFFFAIGARFDLSLLPEVAFAALVMAAIVLALKPVTYRLLLRHHSEQNRLSWDIGFRLGQISEFSLLIAFVALNAGLIGARASTLIEATAIITFLVSSYIVIFNYPNPIAVSDKLRRD
ncbi:cation:proton antiporter [Simiduia agarivorans]|uniref:Sodium/hydrogen antiporter n=1 Tax=Simiduia agarivorans (strain DSM 21679 / JCM 13881 / BCRC 17597 / SA1) TaxID=1117647 RepID=K4KF25_SIMAS|nr:cation:proton antiporter [Simiduia agarivorans]AFU97644.1 sodium/hydrogen antiporter [Simiduia agarivorans SA1 = DSM 21679]